MFHIDGTQCFGDYESTLASGKAELVPDTCSHWHHGGAPVPPEWAAKQQEMIDAISRVQPAGWLATEQRPAGPAHPHINVRLGEPQPAFPREQPRPFAGKPSNLEDDPVEVGDQVRAVNFGPSKVIDDNTTVPPGTEGVVRDIDCAGTVHVVWANGSTLGLVPGHDTWEVLG